MPRNIASPELTRLLAALQRCPPTWPLRPSTGTPRSTHPYRRGTRRTPTGSCVAGAHRTHTRRRAWSRYQLHAARSRSGRSRRTRSPASREGAASGSRAVVIGGGPWRAAYAGQRHHMRRPASRLTRRPREGRGGADSGHGQIAVTTAGAHWRSAARACRNTATRAWVAARAVPTDTLRALEKSL